MVAARSAPSSRARGARVAGPRECCPVLVRHDTDAVGHDSLQLLDAKQRLHCDDAEVDAASTTMGLTLLAGPPGMEMARLFMAYRRTVFGVTTPMLRHSGWIRRKCFKPRSKRLLTELNEVSTLACQIPVVAPLTVFFFAIYLNSMARRCYCSSYRSTNNWFDDLIQIIPISLLFTVCCMCDCAFVFTK